MKASITVSRPLCLALSVLMLTSCGRSQDDKAKKTNDDRAQLFSKAVSGVPSSEEVHQLAASHDSEAVRLLVLIAGGPHTESGTRKAAVTELAKNGSADALEALAGLLVPHEGIRLDAAHALLNSSCSDRCIKGILFYLYRTGSGEIAMQEQARDERLRHVFEENQKRVMADLDNVLTQHKSDVLSALRMTYGLGSGGPSHFSLEIIQRLQMREACDLLIQSEEYQQKMIRFVNNDPGPVTKVIEELGCRGEKAK